MSVEIIGIIAIVVMLVLMFLGMQMGTVMAMVGIGGLIIIAGLGQGISIVGQSVFSTANQNIMTVIPLFILMGGLASASNLSLDAYYVAYKLVGRFPGGLAMATVGGCTGFAAVCGSAIATAATMCKVALPEMRRYKYSDQLSLGVISCGGLLGFMIPPSSAFIIYALFTGESIGSLFIAGILPGLLLAALFALTIFITCRANPQLGPAGPRVTFSESVKGLVGIWGILLLFVLVLGGMYGGIFTPSESGAIGAFGALILGLVKRTLGWKGFKAALKETAFLTGMIFIMIIGATIFNYFIAITRLPFVLASTVSALAVPPMVILILLIIAFVIIGFFMDIMAIVMLTMPIIYPLLKVFGIDPVWFGVLTVLTIMIGQVTPPVGVVVFVVSGLVKDVPAYSVFRGVTPFVISMIIALVILVAFPQISLWLPALMKPA